MDANVMAEMVREMASEVVAAQSETYRSDAQSHWDAARRIERQIARAIGVVAAAAVAAGVKSAPKSFLTK